MVNFRTLLFAAALGAASPAGAATLVSLPSPASTPLPSYDVDALCGTWTGPAAEGCVRAEQRAYDEMRYGGMTPAGEYYTWEFAPDYVQARCARAADGRDAAAEGMPESYRRSVHSHPYAALRNCLVHEVLALRAVLDSQRSRFQP